MKSIKKLLCGVLVLSFMMPLFAGCTDKKEAVNEPAEKIATAAEEVTTTAEVIEITTAETTYPELEIEITSDKNRFYEKFVNYMFIPDDIVLDKWEVVDFVDNIDDFDPVVRRYNYDLWLQSLEFSKNGRVTIVYSDSYTDTLTWTKGYIVFNSLIPKYTIKQYSLIVRQPK